eukprot:Em0434g3a
MYKQNLAPIITLVVSDIKATALEKLYPLLSNDDLRAVKRNSDRYYYPNRTTGQQAVGQSGRPTSRTSLLLNSVNDNEKEQLFALVMEYADVLSLSSSELGRTTVLKHRINTGDSQPVHLPPRRIPQARREEVRRLIQEMLDQGVIQHSDSPWSSPVVLAKKKDGSLRFCVDYRKVNEVTKKDAYPLPRRLIDRVLSGLKWSSCLVYLDDIIVVGKSFSDHLSNLGCVFERLRGAGLKLKPAKCHLWQKRVAFLGHIVSADGIATDPSKTAAVKNWPIPQSRREVQQFLGLANYYRRFVGNFASIAKPLQQLTEKNSNFEWTVECQCAFDELRACLISPPVLSYPDYSRLFILDTDASDIGIGAVLSQVRENGSEGVVAYASRSLSRPERRYCVTRKELLAVGEFVHHFRQYLLGREFTLRTDHGSLVWVRNFKEPEGQLARWLEKLEEYNFTIIHRRGSLHSNADALSRVPCRQCGRENHDSDDVTGEEITVGTFTQALPVSHTPEDMRCHQLDDDWIRPVYRAVLSGQQPSQDVENERLMESRQSSAGAATGISLH